MPLSAIIGRVPREFRQEFIGHRGRNTRSFAKQCKLRSITVDNKTGKVYIIAKQMYSVRYAKEQLCKFLTTQMERTMQQQKTITKTPFPSPRHESKNKRGRGRTKKEHKKKGPVPNPTPPSSPVSTPVSIHTPTTPPLPESYGWCSSFFDPQEPIILYPNPRPLTPPVSTPFRPGLDIMNAPKMKWKRSTQVVPILQLPISQYDYDASSLETVTSVLNHIECA